MAHPQRAHATGGRDWEAWLATAAQPASATEEQERDRTEARIRDAVRRAPDLPPTLSIYTKGSYANNTNVRRDADVDVAVEWTETFKVDTWGKTAGLSAAERNAVKSGDPDRIRKALGPGFGGGGSVVVALVVFKK